MMYYYIIIQMCLFKMNTWQTRGHSDDLAPTAKGYAHITGRSSVFKF